ncbi:hypothetical protein DdX_02070 [Ditylenchus destructor]|uniref:Uncharacterized protein n=1 Tax=Ditylenchus destructor TaxID=166010 RepID=A0AAD4NDM9_9BILA|nr:hypothetical protein DdX_02070 [Ditylenchus destructor]
MSGIVSLIVQFASLVISLAITGALFVHIGGYGLIWSTHASNSTNASLMTTVANEAVFPTPVALTNFSESSTGAILASDNSTDAIEWQSEGLTSTDLDNINKTAENKTWTPELLHIYQGPFEQIQEVDLKIGDTEIDLLSVLRASCILYAGLCIIWLFTQLGLLISLKVELLDLVYVNTFFLAVATIYTLVKALITGILIFYQTELRWNIILIVSISVGGLILCFIFESIALCFIVIWYRYIDYMNGGDEMCLCTSVFTSCIKGQRKSRGRAAAADYSIPEATMHSNLPYIDDPPIQQFSNF